MKDILDGLMLCPIFKGLTKDSIELELNRITYTKKNYSPKSIVAMSDDECRYLHIVISGIVKGEMTDYSGKVMRIEELGAGKPLAPAFIFGENNRYPVDIVTITDTILLSIPKAALLTLLQKNQVVLNNYLGLVSNRAQFLTSRIRLLSFQTIKGRISHYLLNLQKQSGTNPFELSMSHNALSELFGVARPSLTRALREMNNDGLIEAKGKQITIHNFQELRKLTE